MRLDERRGLSRVPPNHSGARPGLMRKKSRSSRSLWLGPLSRGAVLRCLVLARAAIDYLVRRRVVLMWLVWVLGLVCQALLLWLAGEMLDLFISAVELWLELAEKHLRIVLDES